MDFPVYFSKVLFEADGAFNYSILLNVPEKELSFQYYGRHNKILKSIGIQLTDRHMRKVLPYLDVTIFEPYRNSYQNTFIEGFLGYRDEYSVSFIGISNSPFSKIELSTNVFYTEKYTWPNEKLYQKLIQLLFIYDSDIKNFIPDNFACALRVGCEKTKKKKHL